MDDATELAVADAAKAAVAPVPRSHAAWFVAVGGAATIMHWGVAVTLVEYAATRPLLANFAGWLTAVCVSFVGHHRLSFRGHGAPAALSAWRFLLVSAAGFAVNQFAYAVLLSVTSQSYAVLLGAVLASVAAATYIASRCWVFRRKPVE